MPNWNLPVLLIAAAILAFYSNGGQNKRQETKPSQAQSSSTNSGSPLEVGSALHLRAAPQTVTDLKIISYNIRWRGGDDLRRLIKLLREDTHIGGAAIMGLQEVDRKKKRTENLNTAKFMADELGMHYAWTAPPTPKSGEEEETGVAILSAYPLANVTPLILPHEGPGRRRRVALGATVTMGNNEIRFYSVHSETRISVELKIEQLQAVLRDLGKYPRDMPAIVLGDFNTWEQSAVTNTHKLFEEANFHTPFDDQKTFYRRILFFPLELKLDWIWLRNIDVIEAGIERRISLSDHWPLWAVVKSPKGTGRGRF